MYMYMEKILPRRMSTTACSFASYFGQEMAQNADLPSESSKNFSGVSKHPRTPALCQTQGCSVSSLPLFWLTQLSDSSRAPGYSLPLNFIWARSSLMIRLITAETHATYWNVLTSFACFGILVLLGFLNNFFPLFIIPLLSFDAHVKCFVLFC